MPPASYSGSTGSGNPGASPGYGEGRSGWPSPPVTGQHGPGSPGPPSSAATSASQPSPQPTQPPSHSPGPGLPPSPQQHQQQSGPNTQHQVKENASAIPTDLLARLFKFVVKVITLTLLSGLP